VKFEGIYTPAITPLAADGSIDKAAFANVLEYLVESKVHGVIIGGSTGEYYAHTTQERLDLAAQAKDVLNGRLPLIVGTGGIRTEDAVTFAQHAKEIKADALLVGTPPYALPTQQEIADHVKAVDAAAGLPIMLYNYPGRMSVSMGEAFFDAIADSVQAATESQSLNSADVRREVVRAHGRVLAAIAAQDSDAAFRRMQRHVGAYSSLVKTLAEDEGKTAPKKPARRKR